MQNSRRQPFYPQNGIATPPNNARRPRNAALPPANAPVITLDELVRSAGGSYIGNPYQ